MWNVVYYHEDVEENILKFPLSIQAKMFRLLELLEEYGNELRKPHSLKLKDTDGMFELRAKAKDGISRCFYCFEKEKTIYLLHAFIKKDNKTSKKDLDIGKKRLKQLRETK